MFWIIELVQREKTDTNTSIVYLLHNIAADNNVEISDSSTSGVHQPGPSWLLWYLGGVQTEIWEGIWIRGWRGNLEFTRISS